MGGSDSMPSVAPFLTGVEGSGGWKQPRCSRSHRTTVAQGSVGTGAYVRSRRDIAGGYGRRWLLWGMSGGRHVSGETKHTTRIESLSNQKYGDS